MLMIWFFLIAAMLVGYVILDGFDLGAGILHLFVAKNDEERRVVLRTIGPVWDGNEVWLLAAGGTLYFAFPSVYASSFSGFYLPLMMVLWLFIFRAVGIELRGHSASPVWRALFDGSFAFSSILLAVFFGVALGNVIRGVPLNTEHYFFLPLWTSLRVDENPGVLDWYTALIGTVSLTALAFHGARYIVLKTEGEVQSRARALSHALLPLLMALTVLSLAATLFIRPELLHNYRNHPALFIIPLAVIGSFIALVVCSKTQRDKATFLWSCTYLALMLLGAAAAFYPNLLLSSSNAQRNITVYQAAASSYALSMGLVCWIVGMSLAALYFIVVYRMFRGKVSGKDDHHG